MDDSNIGKWAYRGRFDGGVSRANVPVPVPTTQAHKIESLVADRLVMHCGREMASKAKEPWQLIEGRPEASLCCAQCPAE